MMMRHARPCGHSLKVKGSTECERTDLTVSTVAVRVRVRGLDMAHLLRGLTHHIRNTDHPLQEKAPAGDLVLGRVHLQVTSALDLQDLQGTTAAMRSGVVYQSNLARPFASNA